MIVKNEAAVLQLVLPALAQGVDELILVDTGSTDQTVAVAEKYGARVYHFPWIKDFAAARNESLKHATGDWIIWIDADEYLETAELKKLRTAIENGKAEAYEITMCEAPYGTTQNGFRYQRVKAFRNGLGIHFVRPINEQLVDAAGKVVSGPALPITLYHWGKQREAEQMAAKRERYLELYGTACAANPTDPYYHFLLANTLAEVGRKAEAIEHYRQVVTLGAAADLVLQAKEKIAINLLQLGEYQAAGRAAMELYTADKENIPAKDVFATMFLMQGKADQVIEIMTEVTGKKWDSPVENPYLYQALPHYLLGQAYKQKGEREKAEANLALARAIYPFGAGN
ncbi:MAG: glycosyltransferase [Candidatus Margulisbacteria bacterium]|nr:glycosyltransferase [Candidatus Margulisiibacteriota bacterium]